MLVVGMNDKNTRRQAIKLAGSGLSISLLAGCAEQSGGGNGGSDGGSDGGNGGNGGSDGGSDGSDGGSGEPGSDADFLQDGNELKLLIPASPGGGFDSYSRAIAPYFEKHFSELYGVDMTVAPENNAGGGTVPATNQLATTEPKDGSSLMMIHGTLAPTNQIVYPDTVAYDVNDFVYVGQLAYNVKTIVSRAEGGASTWSDAVSSIENGTMNVCADGRGATTHIGFSVIDGAADDFEIDFVIFEAATEAMNGVLRGDGDYTLVNYSTGLSYVNDDRLQYVVAMNDEQPADGTDIPLASEANVPGWETVRDLVNTIRGFTLPPETPEPAATAWRRVFEEAAKDEEFLAWADENGRPVTYADGATMRERTLNVLKSSREQEDFLNEVLKS